MQNQKVTTKYCENDRISNGYGCYRAGAEIIVDRKLFEIVE